MNNSVRYHSLTIVLHWATALALLLAVSSVLLRDLVEDEYWQGVLLDVHRSMGITILILAATRLVTRLATKASHINAQLPNAIRRVAKAGHSLLYVFLLALPFTGWILTNAQGNTASFFGLFNLPMLVAKNRDLADQLGDFHETGAWVFIAVIGVHVTAALWHYFWRKDQVLHSMLPLRKNAAINNND
jgi:cytochrome b561